MSCSSTDKNTQLLRQQITANYQALNAELKALEDQVLSLGELGLPALPSGNLFVGSATNVAAAKPISGDVLLDFNGVTSIASGAIVNDDLSPTAGITPGKLALPFGQVLIGGAGNVATGQSLTGQIGISPTGATTIATGAITNAEISTSAAIDPQKVALTSGRILVGDVNNKASAQTPMGDVSISSAGVTAITAGSIVNADINTAAGITPGKLALTNGRFLIGDGTGKAAEQSLTGPISISSTGVTSIVDGSITNDDINVSAAIATTKLALDAINTKYSYLNGAGTYTIPFGARVVTNETELRAALAAIALTGQPGTIFINGTITITYFLDLTITGLTIMGFNPSQSKIVLSDTLNTGLDTRTNLIIRPERQNITIKGITIQGNNLSPRRNGIESENIRDNSGLTIENCEIKKVKYGITQTGGGLSTPNENIRILNNKISDFVGGIYWNWTTLGLDVVGNTIIGDGSEYDNTKASLQNAIWIGNGTMNLHVCNNNVGSIQRMGIEIFWPHKFNTGTALNNAFSAVSKYKADAGVVITGNTVYDCGSMGISCGGNRNAVVANNSISNVRWIGLELVGDERDLTRPNRYTNMVVTGNHIYNVNGQPRGLGKAYKPTHSTCSQSIQTHFSSISPVDLGTAVGGTVTFNLPLVGGSYPTLQVGKQFIARDTADIAANNAVVKTLTGKISTYNQTTGAVVVTVISKVGSGTISNWTIFICRTLVLTLDTTVAMAWGTNAASATSGWALDANGVPNADAGGQILGASSINLINTVVGGNVDQINGFVTAYNPAVPAVVTIEILSATGSSTTPITTWRACSYAIIVAVSIDIIDGMLFANNYINTAVDAVSLKESTFFSPARAESAVPTIENNYGCQVFDSHNIYISDNVFTRAGYRYLQVLNSRDVVVENNKFVSPTSSYTNTGTTVTKIATGINAGSIIYDPTDPVTELGDSGTPAGNLPNSAVYLFASPKCLLKGNYIKNSTVSNLWYASNGVSLITEPFSRQEVRFGTDLRYRGNISKELDNIILPINCPVVDNTQQWNAATENFTGYRFHVDPSLSRVDSKVLAVSAGSAKHIYNWNFASPTSNAITAGTTSLTFTVTSAQNVLESFFISWFTAAGGANATALPIGTFVRGEVYTPYAPAEFFEGRVTAFTAGAGTSGNVNFVFTCSVGFNTIPNGTYNLWKLHFDQDAFNVSTAGDLVLRKGIQADRTSGTTIATAPTQKLGFWGKAPVVQPVAISAPTAGDLTSTQTTLNQVLAALRDTGIIAT